MENHVETPAVELVQDLPIIGTDGDGNPVSLIGGDVALEALETIKQEEADFGAEGLIEELTENVSVH